MAIEMLSNLQVKSKRSLSPWNTLKLTTVHTIIMLGKAKKGDQF